MVLHAATAQKYSVQTTYSSHRHLKTLPSFKAFHTIRLTMKGTTLSFSGLELNAPYSFNSIYCAQNLVLIILRTAETLVFKLLAGQAKYNYLHLN